MLIPWSRVQPDMVLRTWRERGKYSLRQNEPNFLLTTKPLPPFPLHTDHLLCLGHSSLPSPLLISPPTTSSLTDHLLYLGHSTPSTKSTSAVSKVPRSRGAGCHGVSPGPSPPSWTTGWVHRYVTKLLWLKWEEESEGMTVNSNGHSNIHYSTCTYKHYLNIWHRSANRTAPQHSNPPQTEFSGLQTRLHY